MAPGRAFANRPARAGYLGRSVREPGPDLQAGQITFAKFSPSDSVSENTFGPLRALRLCVELCQPGITTSASTGKWSLGQTVGRRHG